MTWFKVDDSFHSHPKTAATPLAALGLWAVAGAWSGDHLTDGFVPDHMIPLLSRGQGELADQLVAAGLWKKARGGYRFHDWLDRNPSAKDVRAQREQKAAAGRKGGLASGKTRSKPRSKTEAGAKAVASRLVEPPTRPDPLPSLREGGSGARATLRGAQRVAPDPVTHPPHDDDPGNPDWRTLPAYGQADPPPDSPARAAARAAAGRPRRPEPDGPSALDRLRELTEPAAREEA